MISAIVIVILAVVLVLWLAFAVMTRLRKYAQEHKDDPMRSLRLYSGPEAEKKSVSWLGHIHSIWWIAGAGLGALKYMKYIWKAWKTAPDGSSAKLAWGALLALIAAIAVFAIVKLLEKKMDRAPDSTRDLETSQSDESWAYTHARTTSQRESKW